MEIIQATEESCLLLSALAAELWPEHTQAELKREFADLIGKEDAAVWIAFEKEAPAGFCQCQLRRDYVEGTRSAPVGYLEGIYVRPAYRRRGIAGALVKEGQKWAKEQGCAEFASDCALNNTESLGFHLACGFQEVNRIICFVKEL